MKAILIRGSILLLWCLVFCSAPSGAQEKAQDPTTFPPTVVPGTPETPESVPPETPPAPTPPGDTQGTTGASPFNYNGSPFGQFNYITPTVTGAPVDMFNTPRSITTIDATRIAEQAAGNTPELLESLPGVLIQRTNAGGGSLIIRGRNGNQNLIMIDGIPINDASWRFGNVQYLNTIDVGLIERIEVIRGPASVLYGSGALGGVLNIVTKSRKDVARNLDLDGNIITNYSTALESPYNRVEFQGNFLNMGYFVGASYLNVGALYAGENVTFDESIVGYSQRAADVRFDWRMTDFWSATFDYQHLVQPVVPRTDRFPTPIVDPTRFINRPTYFTQNRDFGYFRLHGYDDTPGPFNGVQLTLALQQRREGEIENRPTDRPPRVRDSFERDINGFLDLRGFTHLTDRNTFTYGTSFWHDSVYASRRERRGAGPFRYITPILPPDGTYDQYGVFFMDQQEISDWWIVNGGLRYSTINAEGTAGIGTRTPVRFDRSFQDWSGELGSVVRLTDSLNWVSSLAEGFRAPNLEDLGSSDRSTGQGQDFGASGLSTEYGLSYETGMKYRSEYLAGGATWYYVNSPNQIVRIPVAGGNNVRTNTSGFIHGSEIEGALYLTRNWSLFTTGSHTFGQDTQLDQPLRVIPAFITLGSRWNYRGPRFGLYLEGWSEMMGKQTRLNPADLNDIRIPIGGQQGWQTINLRGGLDGGDIGRLTLGLYNIFDQNYRILGSGLDAPGIDFRVGYEVAY